jgi:hypothetical protein
MNIQFKQMNDSPEMFGIDNLILKTLYLYLL